MMMGNVSDTDHPHQAILLRSWELENSPPGTVILWSLPPQLPGWTDLCNERNVFLPRHFFAC